MDLDRIALTKIAAHYVSWADSDEAGRSAEKDDVSIQSPRLIPDARIGFYAVVKGQKTLPVKQLTDVETIHFLVIALPENAVSQEIMSLLRRVEDERDRKISSGLLSLPELKENFALGTEIDLVVETGEDHSTGEKRYDCMPDYGIISDEIDPEVVQSFKNRNRGYTISEIGNYAKGVKGESIVR